MKRRALRSISLLSLTFSAVAATAGTYSITDLGTLGGSFQFSYAFGLNNSGQVTGLTSFGGGGGGGRAYRYSGGTMSNLGNYGGGTTYGYGINDSGTVVGYGNTSNVNGQQRALVFSGGTVTNFSSSAGTAKAISNAGTITGAGTNGAYAYYGGAMHWLGTLPGGTAAGEGLGINESGTIVGYSKNSAGKLHAFVYSGGAMTDLGSIGGVNAESRAVGINESGVIVGNSETSAVTHAVGAFYYSGGSMHTLGELGAGLGTYASAINDSGKMVGYGGVVSGGQRAIIWNGTTAFDLNTMLGATPTGWVLSQAYGINNSGQITGMGTINGQTHAFLMTPNVVPEPGTWMALGLGATALLRRRRK